MRSKLVAITANTSWYIYNFRRNLINELLLSGYHVVVVAPSDDYSEKIVRTNEALRIFSVDMDQGGTNPIRDFRTFLDFISIFRRIRPDIVLNFTPKNNIYGSLAAGIFRVPVINNIAGLGFIFIERKFSSVVAQKLYKLSQIFADYIFFQNFEDRNLFLEKKLANPNKVERLPGSGVDLKRFQFKPLPESNKFRFLLVARMLYEKGVVEFVDASRELREKYPNIECCVVGMLDANNPSSIPRHIVKQWHEEGAINFLGQSDCVEDEIAKAHCMVLPSYYREGVPRSLLEGAAMGRPIITTDNVGCRETVINNVSGYVCSPRSVAALYSTMERMLLMPREKLCKFGVESRYHIESQFDERRIIERYLSKIKEFVG